MSGFELSRCSECGVAARSMYMLPRGAACSMGCVHRQLLRIQIEALRSCLEELADIAKGVPGAAAGAAVERAQQALDFTRPEER